ncbi:MAG: zinc-binding dehydrogenase [Albidovulum sp.]|uniref:zinc-binding dehydrogenase n=1 Tax=Albidovulum sp. TaxID=1872424 RepID=UPI003CB8D361
MSIPEKMSGVRLTGHGGPETLVWSDDIPVPSPRADEVLVKVLAAGVNPTDINTRVGWYARDAAAEGGGWDGALDFPRIQGGDLCGRVVALGANVQGIDLGARVICPINQAEPTPENPMGFVALGSEYDGAFAEYCCVPARHLFDVTLSPLSDVEIGGMPCAYGTAHNLLTRSGVAAGDSVLITGASGGVGYAAVQLALLRGAKVTAQCTAAKSAHVMATGATVIDREAVLVAGAFDIVIDIVGGPRWMERLDALRPGGRYATSGAIAGPMVEADLRTIYLHDLTIFGCTHQSPETFAALVEIINAGSVRPLISKTYPLRDIGRAQQELQSGTHPGKLVLLPCGGAS